jgi:DNA repair protein RadA
VDPRKYYQGKYPTIGHIDGIGDATVEKLRTLGITTIENLVTIPERELLAEGIGEETVKKLLTAARKAISLTYIKGDDLLKIREGEQSLTTGCKSLDNLLTGPSGRSGLPTQSITEFSGEFGSGKSQLCQQLCVTTQLPIEQGGLAGKVLYIDSESIFLPERVIQLASRFPYFKDNPQKVLKGVIVAEAYTSQHQIVLLASADEVIKDGNVRLIIIDSLTSHFRSEYVGRETLGARQQQLNKHLHKLIRLAKAFNIAAVITNQVSTTPDIYSYGPKPIGGNIVGHAAHTRVFFRKVSRQGMETHRIAKIIASPFMPEGEAQMFLDEYGFHSEEIGKKEPEEEESK